MYAFRPFSCEVILHQHAIEEDRDKGRRFQRAIALNVGAVQATS